MKKFIWFLIVCPGILLLQNLFAQNNLNRNNTNQITGNRGGIFRPAPGSLGVKFEGGFSVYQNRTPEVRFNENFALIDYGGETFPDKLDEFGFLRARFGYTYEYEIWVTRYKVNYSKDQKSAKQPGGLVVNESGELDYEAFLFEVPYFLLDPSTGSNVSLSFGLGAAKFSYDTKFDSIRNQDDAFFRMINLSVGYHIRYFESFDIVVYYNYGIFENAENDNASLQNIMLGVGF